MNLREYGSIIKPRGFKEKFEEKEIWKEFATNGIIKYECSNLGRFRRIGKTKTNYLIPSKRNCFERSKQRNRAHTIIIRTCFNKKTKEYNCKKLLATKFIRELLQNEVVITKNNNAFDLRVSNLFITTTKNLGHITGGKTSKAKKVIYTDDIGLIHSYPSARKCAKELGVSYQCVLDYCNGKSKINARKGKKNLCVKWRNK